MGSTLSGDSLAPLCFHSVPLPYPPPRDTFAKIPVHRRKSHCQGTPPFPSTSIRFPLRTPAKIPMPIQSAPKPFEDTGAPSSPFKPLRTPLNTFERPRTPSTISSPLREVP